MPDKRGRSDEPSSPHTPILPPPFPFCKKQVNQSIRKGEKESKGEKDRDLSSTGRAEARKRVWDAFSKNEGLRKLRGWDCLHTNYRGDNKPHSRPTSTNPAGCFHVLSSSVLDQ